MTPLARLMAIRTGGTVERCHGIMHNGSYSVAAHSWGVATLMYVLWPEHFQRLVIYCLVHDVPEAWVGDIPAPTKFYSKVVKTEIDRLEGKIFDRLKLPNDAKLKMEDKRRLKACDHLELYLWAKEQIYGGNQHAECICRELESFFIAIPLPAKAAELFAAIKYASSDVVAHHTDKLIKELV